MLPILRVIPVGCVLLAITILILALNPPGDPRAHLGRAMAPASGVLIAREQHPEWPQLLMLAALRRADELNRLRALLDAPIHAAPAAAPPKADKPPAVAAVPDSRNGAEPDDVTGTIAQSPGATIPVEIGETSSTELPVIPHEEQPPVIIMPERTKPVHESKVAPGPAAPQAKKTVRRTRRTAAAKKQAAAQPNLLESLFGGGGPAANDQRPFTAQ